jgi:hypothetical protein
LGENPVGCLSFRTIIVDESDISEIKPSIVNIGNYKKIN